MALLVLWVFPSARAQEQGAADPVSLVGISLDELIALYGAPRSVYPVRGIEEWQDDVIFAYGHGEFYIYLDRVWQIGLKSFKGISAGGTRFSASAALGPDAESRGNSLFRPLEGGAWPLMLRCDFDADNKVKAIFVYRPDL